MRYDTSNRMYVNKKTAPGEQGIKCFSSSEVQRRDLHVCTLNPLTPNSDQHLISPHNITPEAHIQVTRIKEMITY